MNHLESPSNNGTRSTLRSKRLGLACALVALPLAIGAVSAQAQVKYFAKPPSAAELRAALLGTKAPSRGIQVAPKPRRAARPSGVRTRGIVWNTPGTMPANNPAPVGASASAVAPVTAPMAGNAVGPAAGMPINFALGSSRLAPGSDGFIQAVVSVMRSDPNVRLMIEGHTDASGGYNRNMVLSWERAMGVYRILVERYQINPARLQPVGKGPSEPMPGTAPNDSTNRRVQFRLLG